MDPITQDVDMSIFKYDSIKRHQFRLLRLTGEVNGKLCGELITSNFSSKYFKTKPYTCLSYMWGSSQQTHQILLNSQPFHVSSNLFSFLTAYSTEKLADSFLWVDCTSTDAYLWIDQICIDQGNTAEKNWTVAMMGEIYRGAKETIVWLGDPRSASYLGNGIDGTAYEQSRQVIEKLTTISESGSQNAYTMCREQLSEEELEMTATIVDDMVGNPYWSRMWIVQEVLLSANLILMYGAHCFRYPTMKALGQFAYYKETSNFTPPRIYELWTERRRSDKGRDVNLSRALRYIEGDCFDVHDKVYAVLGTVKTEQRKLISIDYNMPTKELFRQVLHATLLLSLRKWDDYNDIIVWLGKFLGIPTDLRALSTEKYKETGSRSFQFLYQLGAGIQTPDGIDLEEKSFVELVQFIYDHSTDGWNTTSSREMIKKWLEEQEMADIKDFEAGREECQDEEATEESSFTAGDFVKLSC